MKEDLLPFDYRSVFRVFDRHHVTFLLVGGLNYFLLHKPVATQDIDLLIEDSSENRYRCELALVELNGEWGRRDEDWGPVADKLRGWLSNQSVFCLLTKFGPVDIFLSLPGIDDFEDACSRAIHFEYSPGERAKLISALDLYQCQMALPPEFRKHERIVLLQEILQRP